METSKRVAGSYKDPSGFVFLANNVICRQVNQRYAATYEHLMSSGLYTALTAAHRLVPHSELNENLTNTPNWYKTLLPDPIHFITYAYEWSGAQLRDAGILTLRIMRTAMEHGMILKDATPYNVQFQNGRPVFIDTLSFEMYDESKPWIAYRQFCETFLFPLLLERYTKVSSHHWLRMHPDGISAADTANLLPFKSKLNAGVWLHVFLQRSVAQKNDSDKSKAKPFSRQKLLNLLQHLENILLKSGKSATGTTWGNYYEETIIGQAYLQAKEKIFRQMLQSTEALTALDLGANNGHFSRILAEGNRQVIAADFDEACIHHLYSYTRKEKIKNILPLIQDIVHPSSSIGFNNTERPAFHQRIRTELVAALALIHHLAIGKNIPLPDIAAYLHGIAPQLIIEFPEKNDEKVQLLLSNREDIFPDYSEAGFEAAFEPYFDTITKVRIPDTSRILYFMNRKN
ncbi:class I SAM-dependent methyltransferase [Pseudoflavitalea sp. G-6-1-2]|uniref:class I SAM-dependent methyltransferase n=1 Tax=Pseudoflavitalea sp. G-6-1-2 TaxID=2728841 RepID=UPI00146AE407|nr:class I SAM-dependent methyltransferase [Pseudoflavitalea sp. G-6-1-2]NML21129.1 class I SAM-dependent methyltransferase [Pseudoflavitalea sp. G-6-1-2]